MLKRDGIEVYRGLATSFIDNRNVLPYHTYNYTLTACTQAGCTDSPSVKKSSLSFLHVAVSSSMQLIIVCRSFCGFSFVCQFLLCFTVVCQSVLQLFFCLSICSVILLLSVNLFYGFTVICQFVLWLYYLSNCCGFAQSAVFNVDRSLAPCLVSGQLVVGRQSEALYQSFSTGFHSRALGVPQATILKK